STVAVLGRTVVDNLFGLGQDPIGAHIRIKHVPFRVVGVLEVKGQSSWGQDQDDVILIPFSTAERRVLGTEFLGIVDSIYVSAGSRAPSWESAAREPLLTLQHGRRCSPRRPCLDPFFSREWWACSSVSIRPERPRVWIRSRHCDTSEQAGENRPARRR